MSRRILSLSHDQLTTFDLDTFIAHAEALKPAKPRHLHHPVSPSTEQ
jgi:hypothetical protein